jgi:hypothetical protein
MTSMTKFRWFWAWNDDKEEAWLREMAQNGWHLTQVGFPNMYSFEQRAPRDVAYRLDFFTGTKDKSGYLTLFSDAGWEHVGEYGSWQYFRKEVVNGEAPEIFSDNESKIRKYQRVILVLAFVMCILAAITSNSLNNMEGLFFEIVTFIWFLIILLLGYGIVMLLRRIRQLKR